MQRRVLHHDAADRYRLELGDRRQRAGAADLNFDVAHDRGRLLGGELVRDRPARRARHEAEPLLPIEAVDLVDDAVDIVVERGALHLDLAMKCQQLLDRAAHFGQRIGLEAARGKPLDHAGLRVGRHLAHLAPRVGKKAERPRRRNRSILLPQRSRRRIARIDEERLAGFGLLAVEFEEGVLGHVDFAAHFADRRHAPAFEPVRDVLQRFHVGGHVLADAAVAARRAGDKHAVFVAQRHRQPVDLRLGGKDDLLVVLQAQETADAADKIDDIFFGERIVERKHRHRVPDLGEARRGRRADMLCRAFQPCANAESAPRSRPSAAQRVIFGIRDRRRIVLVIALVVSRDLGGKPRVLGLGLGFAEPVGSNGG